jgi:hydrogen peroxide-dependent heme synthase
MQTPENPRAHPPETLEGWYAQHQIFTYDRNTRGAVATPRVGLTQQSATEGWTTVVELIGSKADLMVMRFAPTLDAIGSADREFRQSLDPSLRLESSFLSITEAGLYHLTAELARETVARGGKVGDDVYTEELARRIAKERENSHVRRRLYPPLPDNMPYVCFYPMSKRRAVGQNWYALSIDERSRLMQSHAKTGRRYAGRVVQIITGSIGFEQWEWGVTLFAADPLDFKKLVTDMRFDEVSAQYAEFGDFYVGKLAETT